MPETSSIADVFVKMWGFFVTDYGFGGVRAIFLTEKAGQEASDVHGSLTVKFPKKSYRPQVAYIFLSKIFS